MIRVWYDSPLLTIRLSEDLWRLAAPLRVHVNIDGKDVFITVPAGFETDFESVPRIPVAFLLTAKFGERAAVLHDYMYKTGKLPRAQADAIYRAALAADDVAWWRRWAMWAGVRVGGWKAYRGAG